MTDKGPDDICNTFEQRAASLLFTGGARIWTGTIGTALIGDKEKPTQSAPHGTCACSRAYEWMSLTMADTGETVVELLCPRCNINHGETKATHGDRPSIVEYDLPIESYDIKQTRAPFGTMPGKTVIKLTVSAAIDFKIMEHITVNGIPTTSNKFIIEAIAMWPGKQELTLVEL